jgi:hypothetical protein
MTCLVAEWNLDHFVAFLGGGTERSLQSLTNFRDLLGMTSVVLVLFSAEKRQPNMGFSF